MKSYYDAHESAYRGIKTNGFVGWGNKKSLSELGDPATIQYLTSAISRHFPSPQTKKALDLGCGTGTTAFTMAKLGFDVTGIDVSETAIEMAQDLSRQQGLNINFTCGDILVLEKLNSKYDLIYDSHCLHCIVFDEDRKKVLDGVKKSLTKDGIFILDTSVATPNWDPAASYDTLRFDENYILWHKTKPSTDRGIVELDGQFWCAQRRFYPAEKVLSEIKDAGFKIVSQTLDLQNPGESRMLRVVLGI